MNLFYESASNKIYRGDAHDIAKQQPQGSFSLAILDGPYAMQKAEWDRMKVSDLPSWYAPHFDDVDRLCAPSASLYVWNTAEGWAELHSGITRRGWVFKSLITWVKPGAQALKSAHGEGARCWPDVTEVCGFYQRTAWAPKTCAGQEIAYAAGADEQNWIRSWLCEEWESAGLARRQADEALGTNGMAGHYFGASQWSLPTWEAYQKLASYASEHGTQRSRPYLVHESCWGATYDHLRATYDHLRAEYEASRPAFICPYGVGNVWTHEQVSGDERLKGEDGQTLHPCQKPLLFADRILRSSTRPGEHVWVPFGGTCREAVAAESLARQNPSDTRYVVTAELDQDGKGYLDVVIRQLRGSGVTNFDKRQIDLFARR